MRQNQLSSKHSNLKTQAHKLLLVPGARRHYTTLAPIVQQISKQLAAHANDYPLCVCEVPALWDGRTAERIIESKLAASKRKEGVQC